MTAEGVDYSFSRPTPAQLKAAGKTFACRYVGTPSSGKNTDPAEVAALHAAGIGVVANFEGYRAGWMSGGRQAGIDAAKAAHADATACGMPPDRPIYFSADYNATYDQYKTQIRPSLQGAASVLGARRVGIYGGVWQVTWAHEDGVAPWMWQTYAWSRDSVTGQTIWYPHAHIRQYRNGVTLGSGLVDLDRAMTADSGQWTITEGQISMADAQDILDAVAQLRKDLTRQGTTGLADTTTKLYDHAKSADLNTAKLLDGLASVMDKLNTGLQVTLDVSKLTPDQLTLVGQAAAGALLVEGAQLKDGKLYLVASA